MKPVILVICDGLGFRSDPLFNAVASARTPALDYLKSNYPNGLLRASGESVGLPDGQMGTSEANHLTIGSGRILYQNLVRINRAVQTGEIFENEILKSAVNHSKKNNSVLHILGILGPGGVHGHSDHLKALGKFASENKVKIVYHLFTDGRDTLQKSAGEYLADFQKFADSINAEIKSIGGRYWGMDRDNNSDRIEKAFSAIQGKSESKFDSATKALESAYANNETDEFITPSTIGEANGIKSGDSIIFANFRSDRAKEISQRIINEKIPDLYFATMTKYSDEINVPCLFPKEKITNTLSETISSKNIKQLRTTETEKFTHLTFFFNAEKYDPDPNEERIMIPTNRDIPTHDKKPEMKAREISEEVIKAIESNAYGLISTNLVNCDMVGHTGNFEATVQGVEAVDRALKNIIVAAEKANAHLIVTADHGNAEEMIDEATGEPLTSHTLNPVHFILASKTMNSLNRNEGLLTDIAPTILELLNIPTPSEMSGKSLL